MKWFRNSLFAGAAALVAAGLVASAASADVGGNTNTSSQQGINNVTSTQSGAAISGNATALDSASATSGLASVSSVFQGSQTLNLTQWNQTDAGSGLNVNGNTSIATQVVGNGLDNTQTNGAASGLAGASGSGTTVTGNATSSLSNIQAQLQTLLQNNQSSFPAP